MKKYLIDGSIAFVIGVILNLLLIFYVYDGHGGLVGYGEIQDINKQLFESALDTPAIHHILELIYALAGTIFFIIYGLTPFYKNRDQGLRQTLISFGIFVVAFLYGFMAWYILAGSLLGL